MIGLELLKAELRRLDSYEVYMGMATDQWTRDWGTARQLLRAILIGSKSVGKAKDLKELYSLAGIPVLPHPPLQILDLKKDKTLKITRTTSLKTWTRKQERELQALLNKMPKGGHRLAPAAQGRIRDLRILRAADKIVVRYAFARATYVNSVSFDPDEGLSSVYKAYRSVKQSINHQRNLLKLCKNKYASRPSGYYLLEAKARKFARTRATEVPTDKTFHVGLELEFLTRSNKKQLQGSLYDAGLAHCVALKEDGSVKPSADQDSAHELTLIVKEHEVDTIVDKVCGVLHEHKAYVNKTCGFHVHLDMRGREARACYQRLVLSLDALYRMLPYERRYNKFCQRNSLEKVFDPTTTDRYYAINAGSVAKHGTLEIRMHSGTVNALKIKSWVKILLKVINTPNTQALRTKAALFKVMQFPKEIEAYIDNRVEKFDVQGLELDDDARKMAPKETPTSQCSCSTCDTYRNTTQMLRAN